MATMLINKINKAASNKSVKQIGALYLSMIIGVGLGIIVSVVNTRVLGTESFGDFKFIQSVYSFFSIILTFGYLVTASKLLAEKKNDKIRKELIGSSVIILLILGLIFVSALFIFSIVQKNIFPKDLSKLITLLLPFFFFIPFLQGLENIYQGENKIYALSVFRVSPQIFYLLILIIIHNITGIYLESAFTAHLSAITLVVIIAVYLLKPSFRDVKRNLEYISSENRLYGFNVYIGSIIGVASTQLGPMVISFFSENNTDVGYYSLAYTITMPLAFIPTVVGTTMFKEFANRNAVSKRSTEVTLLISVVSLLFFCLLIKPIITVLYSADFLDVAGLAYIVAVGQVFHGFGNYYNRFLGSKGRGKELRNGAFFVGAANIIGFILLIPYFGAFGAAITKLVSGLIYTLSMLYYYRLFISSNKEYLF